MHLVMIIVSSLLIIVAIFSAVGKLVTAPRVVATMTHVGVKQNQIPLLAILEIAGGVGLLVGFAVKDLGRAAAAGLVLYFAGAVVSHLRVKDKGADLAPAAILLVLALATLVLQVAR